MPYIIHICSSILTEPCVIIIHLAVIIPTMVSVPWKLTRCAAPPIPADYIHTRTYVGVATVISDLYRCGASEAKVMEFERQALHAAGCLMEILHMCGSTYQNQTHFCKQTLQQYIHVEIQRTHTQTSFKLHLGNSIGSSYM